MTKILPDIWHYLISDEERIDGRFIVSVLATVFFLLISCGYSYFNYYPIHDAIAYTLSISSDWQISLGRFLIPIYTNIKGQIAVPLLTGILSMAYLGCSVFLICEVLGFKKRMEIVFTSGFLSANLFMLEITSVHQYFSDLFLFALLLSCTGVYFLVSTSSWKHYLIAFTSFLISFGIYPAFVTTAGILLISACIRSRPKFRDVITWLLVIGLAGVAYILCSRIMLIVRNIESAEVNWSIFTAGRHSIHSIINSIETKYRFFVELFGYAGIICAIATSLFASICVACVAITCIKEKNYLQLIEVIAFLLIFPLIALLVNVFTDDNAFRTCFAVFLIFPFLLFCASRFIDSCRQTRKQIIISTITVLTTIIVLCNVKYMNGAYTVQRIKFERTNYHMGRVIEDIQEIEEGQRVVFLGTFTFKTVFDKDMEKYKKLQGFSKSTGITYDGLFGTYAKLLGYEINIDQELKTTFRGLEDVQRMPCYPQDGYVKAVDGCIVVKLSE